MNYRSLEMTSPHKELEALMFSHERVIEIPPISLVLTGLLPPSISHFGSEPYSIFGHPKHILALRLVLFVPR
jgi:hypothetical protein